MHSPSTSVRVVVADDHPFYRAALARELRANGIEVVAEVPNAAAAIAAAAEHAPGVVIMDLNMPGMPGAAGIRRLCERTPGARVVVLTVSAEGPDMADAMLSGATGYVLKDDLPEHIVGAVRAAAAGESAISPRAAGILLMRARGGATLGRQELRVLELLAEGRAGEDIAEIVTAGRRSVREHVLGVLLKLVVDDLAVDNHRFVRGHVA